VGGAITEKYDWIPYFAGQHPCIKDVRNEHGSWDIVIQMLSISGAWAGRSGLGSSGWTGLEPNSLTRHDQDNPRIACTLCPVKPPVRVHNYCLEAYRHSTYFLDEEHARSYWLPYLWGHAPEQVSGFYDRCVHLFFDHKNRGKEPDKFRRALAEFLDFEWNWYLRPSGTQTFNDYVHTRIGPQMQILDCLYAKTRPMPTQLVLDATVVVLCSAVYQALAKRHNDEWDSPLLRVLNPPSGIEWAAKFALKNVSTKLAGGWRP
jgi:hypothetical protein